MSPADLPRLAQWFASTCTALYVCVSVHLYCVLFCLCLAWMCTKFVDNILCETKLSAVCRTTVSAASGTLSGNWFHVLGPEKWRAIPKRLTRIQYWLEWVYMNSACTAEKTVAVVNTAYNKHMNQCWCCLNSEATVYCSKLTKIIKTITWQPSYLYFAFEFAIDDDTKAGYWTMLELVTRWGLVGRNNQMTPAAPPPMTTTMTMVELVTLW